MRFAWVPTLFVAGSAFVNALPAAFPIEEEYEIVDMVAGLFEETFQPNQMEDFENLISKRDTTDTIENLLLLLNQSDILFSLLDQIAYSPSRIEWLANFTAQHLGGLDLASLSNLTSSLNLDLNYTAIYDDVVDSGVVTSLLDGILLDEEYQQVIADIISRLLEGNKNLINYVIKDIFKKRKRNELFSKRDNGGTLETFVSNILSSVLNSQLAGDISSDVLVALNETQFLTYTVKRLIADQGYQNMTAQFVIDLLQTGSVTINSVSINVTSIADKLLSKPEVIVTLVSNVLTGDVQLPSLGKYTDAVEAILADVEDDGTFADLNEYIFSETHSVTYPLIATNQIVVAKSSSSSTKASSTTTRASTSSRNTSGSSSQLSVDSDIFDSDFWDFDSTSSEISTTSRRQTTTTSSSDDSSSAQAVASILSALSALSTEDQSTATRTTRTTSTSSATGDLSNILDILAAFGSSDSNQKREVAISTDFVNGVSGQQPNNFVTRALVMVNAVLLGGLMLL